MNRKKIALWIFSIIVIIFTLLTCNIFDRPLTLILPAALYDGDTNLNKDDGIIEIYDYEQTATTIKLEIIRADKDHENNNNDDDDDLTQLLLIPPYVIIPENKLSVEFPCQALKSDVMGTATRKDVSVKATALHYKEDEDTIAIYSTEAQETPVPTNVPTATPVPTPTPTPTTK